MPSAFAVLRLTTSSNLVGCSIGTHFVATQQQIPRHFEAQPAFNSRVDDHVVFGKLLDGQLGWPRTLEYPVHVSRAGLLAPSLTSSPIAASVVCRRKLRMPMLTSSCLSLWSMWSSCAPTPSTHAAAGRDTGFEIWNWLARTRV